MHIIIDDNLYIMINNYTFCDVLKKLYSFFVIFSADGFVSNVRSQKQIFGYLRSIIS